MVNITLSTFLGAVNADEVILVKITQHHDVNELCHGIIPCVGCLYPLEACGEWQTEVCIARRITLRLVAGRSLYCSSAVYIHVKLSLEPFQ